MKNIEYIVYYVDNKPNTVYVYYHTPKFGEIPYGTIFGYWISDEKGKHTFKEASKKGRPFIMSLEDMLTNIIPDKSKTKSFDSYEDFEKDYFMENL